MFTFRLACLQARHAVEFFFGREVLAADDETSVRGPGASVGRDLFESPISLAPFP